jgi:hypothetical protein
LVTLVRARALASPPIYIPIAPRKIIEADTHDSSTLLSSLAVMTTAQSLVAVERAGSGRKDSRRRRDGFDPDLAQDMFGASVSNITHAESTTAGAVGDGVRTPRVDALQARVFEALEQSHLRIEDGQMTIGMLEEELRRTQV